MATASSFLNTLGVNTHAGHATGTYQNSSLTVQSLAYLGIDNVRDGLRTNGMSAELLDALGAAGIKFDFVVASDIPQQGAAGLQGFIDGLKAFNAAHPGSIVSIEGLNEFNLYEFSYQGSSTVTGAVAFQKALYTAVNSSASLAPIPVINFSIGMDDKALFDAAGDLSNFVDFANSHSYTHTRGPVDDTQEHQLSLARSGATRDPVVITETGYTTLTKIDYLGTSEKAQAKLILNGLFDAYENGAQKVYLYELFDGNTADQNDKEAHFGLFRSDGSPKAVAVALHNLTTILSFGDTGAGAPAGGLGYTLNGMPAAAHSMVLSKSNGAKDLVLWAEPKIWNDIANADIVNPERMVTVTLDSVQALIYVYDPLRGTDPIAVYRNTNTFKVPVSDHPVIIEVGARGPVTVAPVVVSADQTLTSEAFVAKIDFLAKATGLENVTLTDSHVLHVSSQATMKHMIANYQSVLSKVEGGYSFSVDLKGKGWSLTTNYDAAGRKTSEVHFGYNSNNQLTNRQTIYADGSESTDVFVGGKLSQKVEVDRDGTSTVSSYENGAVKAVFIKHPDGSAESYDYRIAGQLYTSQHQTFNANGVMVAMERTNASGLVESVTNDNSGRMLTSYQKAADGKEMHFSYAGGSVKTLYIEHANGRTEAFDYGITGRDHTSQHQLFDANGVLLALERMGPDGKFVYTETRSGTDMIYGIYNTTGVRVETTTVHADGSRDSYFYNPGNASAYVFNSYDPSGRIEQSVTRTTAGTETSTTFVGGIRKSVYVKDADGTGESFDYTVSGNNSYLARHQEFSSNGTVVALQTYNPNGTFAYTETHKGGSVTFSIYTATGALKELTTVAADGARDSVYHALDSKGTVTHQVTKGGVILFTDVRTGNGEHEFTARSHGITLEGGGGDDTFIFRENASGTVLYEGGNDRITGFQSIGNSRPDHIAISSDYAQSRADISIKQAGTDVVITIDNDHNITLSNTKVASLAGDFLTFV